MNTIDKTVSGASMCLGVVLLAGDVTMCNVLVPDTQDPWAASSQPMDQPTGV